MLKSQNGKAKKNQFLLYLANIGETGFGCREPYFHIEKELLFIEWYQVDIKTGILHEIHDVVAHVDVIHMEIPIHRNVLAGLLVVPELGEHGKDPFRRTGIEISKTNSKSKPVIVLEEIVDPVYQR